MSGKRKDSKGRVLRSGETQRSDGMYMYRYMDAGGARRTIYSWRLVGTDKIPTGKRACEPLREMEKQLERDAEDGIDTFTAQKRTLNSFFEDYMKLKTELKPSSRADYFHMYRDYVRDSLGVRAIGSIKYSEIKAFFLNLLTDKGLKPNTIKCIYGILHPVFGLAVRDGVIRSNPSDSILKELQKRKEWTRSKRHALTKQQQTTFINYVANSSTYCRWLPIFTVLLGTGCRIGEVTGLRWEDCDFEDNTISINHSLVWSRTDDGKHTRCYISTPKTEAGNRIIPMLSEVREVLLKEYDHQMKKERPQAEIDGFSGFIFQTRRGTVYNHSCINRSITRIIQAYNDEESALAEQEQRSPELLPHFSVHSLRHTFCTRFCENETNLKIIQEIMGHSCIQTTMDIYNEATKEAKKASFANLDGKIRIH